MTPAHQTFTHNRELDVQRGRLPLANTHCGAATDDPPVAIDRCEMLTKTSEQIHVDQTYDAEHPNVRVALAYAMQKKIRGKKPLNATVSE